jgi:PAS domain S-box-containing protein
VIPNLAYPVIIAAIALTGYFSGLLPALICAAWSFIAVQVFFLHPIGRFIFDTSTLVWFAMIMLVAFVIGWLQERLRTTVRTLQATKNQLDIILNAVEDGISVQDKDAQYAYVNPASAKLLGFKSVQAMMSLTPEEAARLIKVFDETGQLIVSIDQLPYMFALRHNRTAEKIVQYKAPELGVDRWLHIKSSPVLDSSGTANQVVNVFRDVTHIREESAALEHERQQSEKRLRDTLDNLVGLAGMLAPDGKLLEANRNALESANLRLEEIVGQPFVEAYWWTYSEDIQTRVRDSITRAAKGEMVHHEVQMRLGENKFALFDFILAPICDEHNEVVSLVFSAFDVSAHKEGQQKIRQLALLLELQRERLEDILNSAPVMVWESEGSSPTNQRLVFLNHFGEKMLGYSLDDWNSEPGWMFMIIHPDDVDYAKQKLEEMFKADHLEPFQFRFVAKTGQIVLVESRMTSLRDKTEQLVGARGVFMDVTARSRIEDELRRSNEELEQFAYVASHDLQEPLRMVTSYLQLLEQRYSERLDDDAREFIQYAVDGAARMKKLITGLLAYSRVQANREQFRSVNMNDVVQRALSNLNAKIKEVKATIHTDDLPVIHGNDTMLVQLVQNLLSNAIKFKHNERDLEIKITVERRRTEWLFAIRDNGIGIDPKYSDRIFIIFQRLHSRSKYSGTGIGLALCKKVVERHQGRIWVASEPEVGSTFFFTLPVQ